MAFFKKTREAVEMGKQMNAQGQAMMDDAYAAPDPNDPAYEPIEGITLERYAELMAALVRQNLGGAAQVEAWVEAQGVKPGTWGAVQAGWNTRMGSNMQVRTRYGMLFTRY